MTQNIAFAPTLPAQLPTGAPHESWVPPTAGRTKFRGPLSIMLSIVTTFALVAAGLLAAEVYARETAIDKIRAAVACQIEDSEDTVSVSFSTSPPVLWQYVNHKYTGFTVTTHGSHIRSAQGMTADIVGEDIDLNGDADKKGTVGAINATIRWTTDGMRQSLNRAVKEAIDEHLKGSIFGFLQKRLSPEFVTGVKTDPSAGTITLEGILNSSISLKPETTADGGIRLVIQPDSFNLGGELNLSQENLQKKLDEMTGKLTDNDLNIRVDSLEVLNDSVVGKFSAKNVDIPKGDGQPGGCEGL